MTTMQFCLADLIGMDPSTVIELGADGNIPAATLATWAAAIADRLEMPRHRVRCVERPPGSKCVHVDLIMRDITGTQLAVTVWETPP